MSKYLLENQESERLLYRKVAVTDFEDWLPFYQNPESTRYWEGLPIDPKEACQQQFDFLFERYQKNLGGMNALVSKETGRLLGMCGLLMQKVDEQQELEIGYSILPQYWQKGYAIEAATKCKQYARQYKLAKSLISIIHVDNVPSQKVALKNGMHLDITTVYKENPVHIYRIVF